MCGITGFFDFSGQNTQAVLQDQVELMTDAIRHRGPDDSGAWINAGQGIALGFRRLAILDLSPTGHQPMLSADERYVIIFNGEIYNFADLRSELVSLGHGFRGTSDTEVMLAGIVQWGVEGAVRRFNGMFSIALWDRQEQVLSLIRDRLGIKPLYYGWSDKVFLFGSELKALRAHPSFNGEIDRDSLTLYMRHNYIPAPHSIYRNIRKLAPGMILSLHTGSSRAAETLATYWSAREAAENGVQDPFRGTEDEAISGLDSLLRDSVRLRMIADVPLGAFLSGGIDSSVIVAMMQSQSRLPVKTFTIGFHEAEFNEAEHARAIAAHLGTDHTELYVKPEDAQAVIPRLPSLYDEPFADSSQIPTFLVSQLARQQVTVSLSGDGGDELFGGYSRYLRANRVWNLISWMPAPVSRGAAGFFSHLSRYDFRRISRPDSTSLPPSGMNNKLYYLAELLKSGSSETMYQRVLSYWAQPQEVVIDGREPPTLLGTPKSWPEFPEYIHRMMYQDLSMYLPDDILVKLDRASMGVSLEGRVPFLDDHRVVEYAWRLPLHLKVRGGTGKYVLRKVLYRYVPEELMERPKMGFGVPIDSWLRGPLRAWAESLLDENRLKQEGYFNPNHIREKWTEHLSGKFNWQNHLWDVLMFQAWLEANS